MNDCAVDTIDLPMLWPKAASAQGLLEVVKAGVDIQLPSLGIRRYGDDSQNGAVTVVEFAVDFNDPAACTELRARNLLAHQVDGVHYLNPQFTVMANVFSQEFIKRMISCSGGWLRNLDHKVNRRGRKSMYKQAERREQSLGYTGVIIINGTGPHDARPMLRELKKLLKAAPAHNRSERAIPDQGPTYHG